jgi:toxin CcdB
MARFDVYLNRNPETSSYIPYLLDVQAELLDVLATRVVVPLYTLSSMPKPARHLNPVFEINGERLVLSTAELAGVPMGILGEVVVCNVASHRDKTIAALDFLFTEV